jgi:hypothetical protein
VLVFLTWPVMKLLLQIIFLTCMDSICLAFVYHQYDHPMHLCNVRLLITNVFNINTILIFHGLCLSLQPTNDTLPESRQTLVWDVTLHDTLCDLSGLCSSCYQEQQ